MVKQEGQDDGGGTPSANPLQHLSTGQTLQLGMIAGFPTYALILSQLIIFINSDIASRRSR